MRYRLFTRFGLGLLTVAALSIVAAREQCLRDVHGSSTRLTTPQISLASMPVGRAVRCSVVFTPSQMNATAALAPEFGFVLTSIAIERLSRLSLLNPSFNSSLAITIAYGSQVEKHRLPYNAWEQNVGAFPDGAGRTIEFNPPIVIDPSTLFSLTLGYEGPTPAEPSEVFGFLPTDLLSIVVGGYIIYPGEL